MEDEKNLDATIELDDQDPGETEGGNSDPSVAAPAGEVIIIK